MSTLIQQLTYKKALSPIFNSLLPQLSSFHLFDIHNKCQDELSRGIIFIVCVWFLRKTWHTSSKQIWNFVSPGPVVTAHTWNLPAVNFVENFHIHWLKVTRLNETSVYKLQWDALRYISSPTVCSIFLNRCPASVKGLQSVLVLQTVKRNWIINCKMFPKHL